MRYVLFKSSISLLVVLLCVVGQLNAQTAAEIVSDADQFRGYRGVKFQLGIQIVGVQPKKTEESTLLVYTDSESSLAQFLTPVRSKGQFILSSGQNMWIKLPRGSKILRISPVQRLLGQVSNGDVARTNLSGDYDAELVGEEEVEGELCHKLLLTRINKNATYSKIDYWVSKTTGRPVKSLFYALSGKLLKTAFYREFKTFDSEVKLSRMLLIDALRKDHYTWMIFKTYSLEKFPDNYFRKEYLNQVKN